MSHAMANDNWNWLSHEPNPFSSQVWKSERESRKAAEPSFLKARQERTSTPFLGLFGRKFPQELESTSLGDTITYVVDDDVEVVFREHADRWERETEMVSSVDAMVTNPSYLRIIGLGPAVLPLILEELSLRGGYWFPALSAITGDDPVPEQEKGNTRKMTQRWLEWWERTAP